MPKNYSKFKIKIAIIGGSGLYDPKIFKKTKEIKIKTPFGFPSAPLEIGDFSGEKIVFLARHGKKHQFPPHKVPQKANLWALKSLGIERIIGVCAVGSLKENFKPGEIVICDQFVDFTKKREYTFYDRGGVHISLADPFCPELRDLFYKEARKLKIPLHQKGTYWCIEGPRFSSRAESNFFRKFADIIGMTLIPEAVLARELEICYLCLATITDWDVWKVGKEVSAEKVIETMNLNLIKTQKILKTAIPKISRERVCPCKEALKDAEI